MLRCIPLEVFPKPTPAETLAEVRRALPNASAQKAQEVPELLTFLGMGTELGRTCTATAEGQAFLTVQVTLD